ncbi:MAG TPA: hypothetical protein VLL08_13380 [Kineosporiaceae bacterium]|nr:hypothetical protein [Kineosporiaceae bacterium]
MALIRTATLSPSTIALLTGRLPNRSWVRPKRSVPAPGQGGAQ